MSDFRTLIYLLTSIGLMSGKSVGDMIVFPLDACVLYTCNRNSKYYCNLKKLNAILLEEAASAWLLLDLRSK